MEILERRTRSGQGTEQVEDKQVQAIAGSPSYGMCNCKARIVFCTHYHFIIPSIHKILFSHSKHDRHSLLLLLHFDLPNAPPISAPLVGMLTLTIPQSDPNGLGKIKHQIQFHDLIRHIVFKSGYMKF